MARLCASALVLGLALVGCGGDDDDVGFDAGAPIDSAPAPDGPPTEATSVYVPPTPGAGADWGTVPFPSDLYLDADGLLTVGSLPFGPAAGPEFFVEMYQDAIHAMRGFGVWTNVYIPIDGEVDPETLSGNVHVVDLDNGLAEIPVDVIWRGDLDSIVVALQVGTVLGQDRRYAAYMTDGVRSPNGASVAPASEFAEAIDLDATPSDPAVAAMQDNLRPLIEAVDQTTAASLVSASVFTTRNITDDMVAMRDIVNATPPVITITAVDTDLDTLMGVAAPDDPPGLSISEWRGQPHSNVAAVVHGTIGLSSFLTATPGVADVITFEIDGTPIVKNTDVVKFSLILPAAASYDALPVMVYVHSFRRNRHRMLIQADAAAAEGIAVLAVDHIFHGDRADSPVDATNEITGVDMPDGFGDDAGFAALSRALHLSADNGYPALHPGVMQDNGRQAAMDVVSLVSFVGGGDVAPINTALAGAGLPADLAFRTDGVAVAADSLGSLLSGVALAVEPRIKIAVLNVAPAGVLYPAFFHSPEYGDILLSFMSAFDINNRVTLGDPLRDARYEPIFMFWNYFMEKMDAGAFAPYVLSGELRGDSGPSVMVSGIWADEIVPNIATEHYAAALGIPRMPVNLPTPIPGTEVRYATLEEVTAPVSGNIAAGQTAALVLWYPGTHYMGTFLNGRNRYEPEFPPFVDLVPTVVVDNHTAEFQQVRASFLADWFAGATPTLDDPF